MDAPIVIRRGGFLTSLVTGICGVTATVLVIAAVIGIYALNIVDRKSTEVFGPVAHAIRDGWPHWQEALPRALAEAIDDRRAPEYRDQIELIATIVSSSSDRRSIVLTAQNEGPKVVSLLAVRVIPQDAAGNALDERQLYVATPVMLDNDWRGPILPGAKRRCVLRLPRGLEGVSAADVEISELRCAADRPAPAAAETAALRNPAEKS